MKSLLLLALLVAASLAASAEQFTFTTLAGYPHSYGGTDGLGTAARFHRAAGIAMGPDGALYVADNVTFRKVTLEGVVSTPVAQIFKESGFHNIAVDPLGNVYVMTTQLLCRIGTDGATTDIQLGAFDTSGGVLGYYTPLRLNGIAVDSDGNVYISDSAEHTIRKVTRYGAELLAGYHNRGGSDDGAGSGARFYSPHGLAADRAGNLYVADYGNHTIRMITPNGQVSTMAGAPGVAGDADGIGSLARFRRPDRIAIDQDGVLWVTDNESRRVRQVTAGGRVSTRAITFCQGIALDGLGRLYVTSGDRVKRIDGHGLVTHLAGANDRPDLPTDGIGPDAEFWALGGVAVDRTGTAFVADRGAHAIRAVAPDGRVTTVVGDLDEPRAIVDGPVSAARVDLPSVIAADRFGNVIFADQSSVRKLSAEGVVTTVAGSPYEFEYVDATGSMARFIYISGLAVDSQGNIFVADSVSRTIRKITPAGAVSTVAGRARDSGLSYGIGWPSSASPNGLATDHADNVFVADAANGSILKITPTGVVSTYAGNGTPGYQDGPAAAAQFDTPVALAFDRDGNLFVTEYPGRIRKIDTAGTVTTIAAGVGHVDGPAKSARFNSPAGISIDPFGHLYISDAGNSCVRKGFVPGSTAVTITQQPEWTHELAGNGVLFSVQASGFPEPEYQWQRRRAGAADFVALVAADGFRGARSPELGFTVTSSMHGDFFRCVVSNGVAAPRISEEVGLAVTTGAVQILGQIKDATVHVGSDVELTVTARSDSPLGYQWFANGSPLEGATSSNLRILPVNLIHAGIYQARIATEGAAIYAEPMVLGLMCNGRKTGGVSEVGENIHHPNGNTFDQMLMHTESAVITADQGQITRTSFVDMDNDIVQVEFSGAGSLTIVLEGASPPATPAYYNQRIEYMKGHARIVVADANESTHISVFSVGRITALDQSLFRDDVNYDGVADIGYIAVLSRTGKCGALRTGNTTYSDSRGITGVYAPGVEFVGPVVVGDVEAFEDATPALSFGPTPEVLVAGGSLAQPNGRALKESGIGRLRFVPGQSSQGVPLAAQPNAARFSRDGLDVTDLIVVNPE